MDWLVVLQTILVWIMAQGFISLLASKLNEWWFKTKHNWFKVFLLYVICFVFAIVEAAGTKVIDITTFNFKNIIELLGLMQTLVLMAMVWFKFLVKPIEQKIAMLKLKKK